MRELVQAAGIDVSTWSTDRFGNHIENANTNSYRSFKWSFSDTGLVVALFLWHHDIDWESDSAVKVENSKHQQDELNALADKAVSPGVRSRLGIKIRRTRDFQNAVYEAYSRRLTIRVVLLEGKRTELDDAADESSEVKFRELDLVPWYAHAFDPYTGEYRLVRGVQPPTVTVVEPFDDIEDPGLDPAFQTFVQDLEETEREALIKARVGQGPFRDGLFARWKGCSVTGCQVPDLLVASHIKPWSKCTTPAERLGAANGLLLIPNLDKLFDRGFITFDLKFTMRISPLIIGNVVTQLNVHRGSRLRSDGVGKDLLTFLEWHADSVFKKGP